MTLADRMRDKALTLLTIEKVHQSLVAVQEAIGHFDRENRTSGYFTEYLKQLYEERDALLMRKSELRIRPTPQEVIAEREATIARLKNVLQLILLKVSDQNDDPSFVLKEIQSLIRWWE